MTGPAEDGGPSEPRELLARALQLRAGGDRRGALHAVEQAGRLLEDTDHGTLLRANTQLIAGLIAQDDGDHERATELFTAVVHVAGEGEGAQQLRTHASTLLAALHRIRGDYPTAERLLRQILLRTHDAAGLAAAHNELGMTLRYAGRFDEADDSYRTARTELERLHGPDHPEMATIHHNLSGLAHARGDLAPAEASARTALTIRKRALGPDHPATVADQGALAAVLVARGQLDEAVTLLDQVLAAVEQINGPEHHEVAVVLHNLGSAAHSSGHPARAIELLTRSVEIKERVLGREHPELAVTLCNLGLAQRAAGDAHSAAGHFRRAVAVLEPTVASDHPVAQICREALSHPGGAAQGTAAHDRKACTCAASMAGHRWPRCASSAASATSCSTGRAHVPLR